MTKSDGIVARIAACLTPEDKNILGADLTGNAQMTGFDRRTRLALRIALLQDDRIARPAVIAPAPAPEPEPMVMPEPEPEVVIAVAPPKPPKPPKIKMSTVGLQDAAALLGSAFDDFPDTPEPSKTD